MNPLRFRYRTARLALAITLCALAAMDGSRTWAQPQAQAGTAELQGAVRNGSGLSVAGATVHLQGEGGSRARTARTDSAGTYIFSAVLEGRYTIRAEMTGYAAGDPEKLTLAPKETKKLDLRLGGSLGAQAPAGAPEFFDEPQFTVAGVTQATNSGGHGSDVVLRNTEALAKATLSLSKEAPAGPPPLLGAAAEKSLRDALQREPESFAANYRLGKVLVEQGKPKEAIPYLDHAGRLNPKDYANAYELARARAGAGDLQRARAEANSLLAQQDKAELHHLLADIEERQGNPLEAVREYQRAAEMNPSESNLFDWGAELLAHRALEPAIQVLAKGNRLFPRSPRMLVGLSVAWYARGSYDQAAKCIFDASDLDPNDPTPYLFMGKMQSVQAVEQEGFAERLGRFAKLQPGSALANYYYAVSLKKKPGQSGGENSSQIEALLETAVQLDPGLGVAYLQLGILSSERGDFPKAMAAYQKAIQADPNSEEAHYRLAQAYRRVGEKTKAREQLDIYDQLSKKTAAQVERERREVQQFVISLRAKPVSAPADQKP